MNERAYWGPPGPWRDRFERLAIELRIAVLTRDAVASDGAHWRAWNLEVLDLERELRIARECHRSEHLPPGTTFYVSAEHNGDHVVLAGPFPTHEEALRLVPRARAVVDARDPRGFQYGYGTLSAPPGEPLVIPFPEVHAAIVTPPPPPPPPVKGAKTRRLAAYTHGPR